MSQIHSSTPSLDPLFLTSQVHRSKVPSTMIQGTKGSPFCRPQSYGKGMDALPFSAIPILGPLR